MNHTPQKSMKTVCSACVPCVALWVRATRRATGPRMVAAPLVRASGRWRPTARYWSQFRLRFRHDMCGEGVRRRCEGMCAVRYEGEWSAGKREQRCCFGVVLKRASAARSYRNGVR